MIDPQTESIQIIGHFRNETDGNNPLISYRSKSILQNLRIIRKLSGWLPRNIYTNQTVIKNGNK